MKAAMVATGNQTYTEVSRGVMSISGREMKEEAGSSSSIRRL